MALSDHIAKHLRGIYFGDNWTAVNLKDRLADVSWKQATTQVYDFHTIATLVYHLNYYVTAVLKVLRSGPLDAHDKYSFDCPPIANADDWQQLVEGALTNAEELASMIEQFSDSRLWEDMEDPKYGSFYRNFQGIIEHNYYHLGQIALTKTLVTQT